MKTDANRYVVRLAQNEADIAAAQRLRYRVFVEEMGATATPAQHAVQRESDAFDPYFEHLLLVDTQAKGDPLDAVVGAYRLMRGTAAKSGIGFYGASEYDLSPLENSGREILELGRSCIAPEVRGGLGMHQLWNGLGSYVIQHKIGIMFGVASFHGVDPEPLAQPLSYLYHSHLAPPELRVQANPASRAEMDVIGAGGVDRVQAMRAIPSLIKAYLRLGGFVGDGAFIDRDFNTIDVCLVMDTDKMAAKYRAMYSRGAEI